MVERPRRCIGIAIVLIVVTTLIIVLGIQLHMRFSGRSLNERIERFERQREAIYLRERFQRLGGKIELCIKETFVNNRIMTEKLMERDVEGSETTAVNANATAGVLRNDGDPFVFERIHEKALFKLLRTMPKGAALHVKDFAMCSGDCLVALTYHESLWVCMNNVGSGKTSEHIDEYVALRFSRGPPASDGTHSGCKWVLLQELRSRENSSRIDQKLRKHFTLRTEETPYRGLLRFEKLIYGLLTFEPIWSAYLLRSLEFFAADNIQYMEIFSTLPTLYNLERSNFTYMDTARIMRETIMGYSAENTDFIGAMVIYEPPNKASTRDYNKFLERAIKLKNVFPDFFAGINLASNVQVVSPLYYSTRNLIALQDELDFFYHIDGIRNRVVIADENLLDSVLLGSRRVTYNSAFFRHPELMRSVHRSNIAVEICPTTIVKESLYSFPALCDHSSAYLFATGFSMVLTSEYPGFWHSKPLTDDFYLAFVGIASKTANLGTLKQLAWNSLQFTSVRFARKQRLFRTWTKKWEKWIDEITECEL